MHNFITIITVTA